MTAFTPPEEGSTDASTHESGEDGLRRLHEDRRQHQQNANASVCDSLSSFPLLSTNAKEGLTTEAAVHYAQPGNIPQLQVSLPGAAPESNYNVSKYLQVQAHGAQEQPMYSQSSSAKPTPRSQHLDMFQRQHGEELQQLEKHLKYLEEQQQQLEEEIQGRQRSQPEGDSPSDEYVDDRPRAVRFASMIAQNLKEEYESKKGGSHVSPTCVVQLDAHDNSDNSNSVLAPKTLFPGKPKSILRRKGPEALDATGRYPSATRGRSHVPVFTDVHGREVSPIRSPARPKGQQAVYQMEARHPEDTASIPDNPGAKDIAVLFDPEADEGQDSMRREVCTFDCV